MSKTRWTLRRNRTLAQTFQEKSNFSSSETDVSFQRIYFHLVDLFAETVIRYVAIQEN